MDSEKKQFWNNRRSLLLSKVCTVVSMAALVAVLLTAPHLVGWLTRISINASAEYTPLFLVTLYAGGLVGAVLLVQLYLLLRNIGAEAVFSQQNVTLLRRISWCCMLGAAIALVSGLYYMPWAIVGLGAGFIGLIVRVVKNVFARALEIKEENDYTI